MDERRVLKDAITSVIAGCERCPLANSRNNTVPFATPLSGDLLTIVGEAPGAEEDSQGKPFVGRSGQFLNSAVTRAKIEPKHISIMNTICCRPPGNRDPKPLEKTACSPNFEMQLKFTQSWFGLCLGLQAASSVLGITDMKISDMRNNLWWARDKIWAVTYHPSAAMRNANISGIFREDIQTVGEYLRGEKEFSYSNIKNFSIAGMSSDDIKKAFKSKGWFPVTIDNLGSIICTIHPSIKPDDSYSHLPTWTVEELVKIKPSSPGFGAEMVNIFKTEIPGTYLVR